MPSRQIADVGHADERQQVVLAHAVEADVPHQHHFVVLLGEHLLAGAARIEVQPAEQLGVHPRHAGRRFQQPLAIGVLADRGQNLPHRPLDPRQVDGGIDLIRFFRHERLLSREPESDQTGNSTRES